MEKQKCDCGAQTEGKWADVHAPTCPAVRAPDEAARLRSLNAELVKALEGLLIQAIQSTVNHPANEWGQESLAIARAALTGARAGGQS